MKTRYSFVLAGLALALAFATPVVAQETDVAKEKAEKAEAAQMAEKGQKGEKMMRMGEGCQCECMKEVHEKMKAAHSEAEGVEMDEEAHAEMMKELTADCECAADCKCMQGEMGEGEMACKMHKHGKGEMGEGEGMQHRHGMESDDDSDDAGDDEGADDDEG